MSGPYADVSIAITFLCGAIIGASFADLSIDKPVRIESARDALINITTARKHLNDAENRLRKTLATLEAEDAT